MSAKRVMVVAADVLPLPGFPTTGAGYRAWALGKGLEARGHEVVFSMPQVFVNQGREVPGDIAAYAWTANNIDSVISRVKPDVVVFCHWPALCVRRKLDIPTVLDFQGPHLLEREMEGYGHRSANIREKLAAIHKADFFTCAGDKQRLYFFSWLLAAGINLSEDVIATIPTSLSPELPDHDWNGEEPAFVYGGYFLPWQDPFDGLEMLLEVMSAKQRGRLKFFGGPHPGYADYIGNIERFDALEKRLRQSPRVEMRGVVPFDQLIEEYRHAQVALDVMGRNPERELAVTTRTLHYLWCGLPVIYHDYAELSGYIEEYQAGWIVDPADRAAIRQAIEEALDYPEEVRRRGENAQRLVRERLTWDKTIEPLDAFCRNPWQREPVAMPAWPASDGQQPEPPLIEHKALSALAREALYHYRHGGVRTLAYYTLGFLHKQLDPDRRQT